MIYIHKPGAIQENNVELIADFGIDFKIENSIFNVRINRNNNTLEITKDWEAILSVVQPDFAANQIIIS